MSEKLQKVLARAGYGSRRKMEEQIAEGRVNVNGRVAKLGDRVSLEDKVTINGKPVTIQAQEEIRTRVIIINKQEGVVCTQNDPDGRQTVFQGLPRIQRGRWIGVGRLDINSSGLYLVTTDGELANRLMHPSSEIEREYAVRVYGEVTPDIIRQLKKGVELDDGLAKFSSIKAAGGEGKNQWFHVCLFEGRNREVRRLFESQGVQVSRLTRVRFGNITLPRYLRQGKWQELNPKMVAKLAADLGLKRKL